MFYQLPPVGNPVLFTTVEDQEAVPRQAFSPYQVEYYNSGTASLAAAIAVAIRSKSVDMQPEVLLPAYGCPDLVSATVYAGARPVLVDLERDRPWMDLEQLRSKISARTVAVIAASLFGISERMPEIRSITKHAEVLLIEDSAQAFPVVEQPHFWHGDLVVLSFGRGKPVSLLGGGAVLFRQPSIGDLLPTVLARKNTAGWKETALLRLKTGLYNRMISPRLYWLPLSLPFLHLGETRYHSLRGIAAMDPARLALLPANIAAYRNRGQEIQRDIAAMIREADQAVYQVIDLPEVCEMPSDRRLLRYPLLVDDSVRERLLTRLMKSGVGPSVMYPAALPGISGLAELFEGQGPFPMAESFAERILTLPTHSGVSARDIVHIREILTSN